MAEDEIIIDPRMQEDYLRRPRVLCIITTYNRPELLKRAIESVMAQTLQDWFLTVIDDGSTDPAVLDVLNDMMIACENRMEYQFMGENSGRRLGKVRNEGIRSGLKYDPKYICFLDDDNEMEPTFMQEMVTFLDAQPKVDMVYCDSVYYDNGIKGKVERSRDFDVEALKQGNYIDLGEGFLRREVLDKAGLFDEDFTFVGDDWVYWNQVASTGHTIVHYPRALCRYYRHPGQTTNHSSHRENLHKLAERIWQIWRGERQVVR